MLPEEELYTLGWEGACVEVAVTEPPTQCARCRRDQEDIYPIIGLCKVGGLHCLPHRDELHKYVLYTTTMTHSLGTARIHSLGLVDYVMKRRLPYRDELQKNKASKKGSET